MREGGFPVRKAALAALASGSAEDRLGEWMLFASWPDHVPAPAERMNSLQQTHEVRLRGLTARACLDR